MRQWVRLELSKKPYRNPKDNTIRDSINGLNNRANTKFVGGGHFYPTSACIVFQWLQSDCDLMWLVDTDDPAYADLMGMSGFKPKEIKKGNVLDILVKDIGLPDSTILDTDLTAIVPSENPESLTVRMEGKNEENIIN